MAKIRQSNNRMHYADYKTILSPKNGMNVYRGCTHGCIYCDSRSKCYQMSHDFEDIEVKRGAAEILEKQLAKKRKPCMIGTGAMCDPYIPLEEELQVTKRCLQVIEKHGFGLAILTKSARILRDMDILKAINAKAKCVVQMTLTTHDETLCKIIESNVTGTLGRFETLKTMRDAGIPTIVWLGPILPFVNDTEKNLRGILEYCVEANVRGILCFGFGVTMRDGNREYFYRQLDRHFSGLKQRYMKFFGKSYHCASPNNAALMEMLNETCRKHGMLCNPDDVFRYTSQFDAPTEGTARQPSLFEET